MMMMIIISINLRSEKNVAFKGEVRQIFLLAQSFYGPKQREVSMGNFHRKAPNCPNIGSECQKLTK